MQLFNTILPIVLIAVAGYGISRSVYLSGSDFKALEKFAFNLLVPALLFSGTARVEFPDRIHWALLSSFFGGVLSVYVAGMLLGAIKWGRDRVSLSLIGMGGAYSNVTIVGIPVCLQVFGEAAFLPMFMIISVHNLTIFTFGSLLAEWQSGAPGELVKHLFLALKNVVSHPVTGSLLVGLLVNISGLPLYTPLLDTLALLGQAAVPASLFVLGASLSQYRIRGQLGLAFMMVALKLLVLPLTVWCLGFRVFSMDPVWAGTAVLLSAMPVGISVYVFSKRYQVHEAPAASAIVISSLLSVFSIPFFTYLAGG